MLMIGNTNVRDYIKMIESKNKIQQKFFDKQENKILQLLSTQQPKDEKKTQDIGNKLRGGIKLSASELDYLSRHEPNLYIKAIRVDKERRDIEQKIKSCKSKEEYNALRMSSIGNVSGEKDSDMCVMRTMAISDTFSKNEFSKKEKKSKLKDIVN